MAAEQDTDFLPACFIDTGDYDLVKTGNDKRIIVLGRTGSGKSAASLFQYGNEPEPG